MPGYVGTARPYQDGPREAELSLVALFPYLDGFGHCLHFRDSRGRLFVWFSKANVKLSVGDRVLASFVVYAHRDFHGLHENLIRKLKILEHR